MADLVVPAAPALATVPDVELCAVGTWNASTGTTTFTREDLAACVSALDCPGVRNPVLKLGHDEADGAGLRWDGEPTVGWIANMRLADNDAKVVGDYTGMPGWLASVLPSAYPDRSIEMYRPFKCQIGHSHPAVITAVALLGVSHPAVGVLQSLQDVAALYEVQAAPAVEAVAVRHEDVVYLTAAPRAPAAPVRAASGMDADAVQAAWQDALDGVLEAWPDIAGDWRAQLADQIEAAVAAGDLAALTALVIDSGAAAALLAAAMLALAATSADQMVAEAAAQGVTVEPPPVEEDQLGIVAAAVAALLAAGLANAAAAAALRLAVPGAAGAAVAAEVAAILAALSLRAIRDQVGGALSTAQAAGRFAVLHVAPDAQYVADEVLDGNTCQPCRDLDGTVFKDLAAAAAAYGNGAYVYCQGGVRCRGQITAVWPASAAATLTPRRVPVRLRIEGSPSHGDQGFRLRVH
jgi:hypothetical protein